MVFALLVVLGFRGFTFAANLNLNSGVPVQFGQGVLQTVSCAGEQTILITPFSKFDNSTNDFKFNKLVISQIPESCLDKDFVIKAFGEETLLLDGIHDEARIQFMGVNTDSLRATKSGEDLLAGTVTGSTDSITIELDPATAVKSELVKRITVETQEGSQWVLVYQTTNPSRVGDAIQYSPGYGIDNGSVVISRFNNAKLFTKIKIRMENTMNGTPYYAEVSFDKWPNASLNSLQIPDIVNNSMVINQENVQNMIVKSNYPGVVNGSNFLGRVEIWAGNYSQWRSGKFLSDTTQGSDGSYDFDDTAGLPGYGSFQIHNITSGQTVLAWNAHFQPANLVDVGFGNSPSGSPDWTFAWNGALDWKLQIFVN